MCMCVCLSLSVPLTHRRRHQQRNGKKRQWQRNEIENLSHTVIFFFLILSLLSLACSSVRSLARACVHSARPALYKNNDNAAHDNAGIAPISPFVPFSALLRVVLSVHTSQGHALNQFSPPGSTSPGLNHPHTYTHRPTAASARPVRVRADPIKPVSQGGRRQSNPFFVRIISIQLALRTHFPFSPFVCPVLFPPSLTPPRNTIIKT